MRVAPTPSGSTRLAIVHVPAVDVELAADRLRQAGAWAIEERGTDPVELRTVVANDLAEIVRRLGEVPATWRIEVEDAAEVGAELWREHARAAVVSPRITIHPAWRPVSPRAGHLDVVIEPGSAFGLGDHPTTRLSAAAVERVVRPGDRVLDVGCGSGVLSVVAALLGAKAVEAIDVSPAAADSTRDNSERNDVAGVVGVSTTRLRDVVGEFDAVVANILAPELVAMAPDLRRTTAPHGRLIISGILAGRHDHVLAALRPMLPVGTTTMDEWAAVELAHP